MRQNAAASCRVGRGAVLLAATVLVASCGTAPDETPDAAPATTQPPSGGGQFGEIETAYVGRGPRVLVFGDSIMVATKRELRARLTDHALKVAAITGEGLSGGSISRAVGGGAMPEVAAGLAGDAPDVVVIELGTNDAWFVELGLDDAREALQSIEASFDGACLVVVAISEGSRAEGYDRTEAREINRSLRALADEVVEWGAMSAADPERYLRPDEIHPTAEGVDLLAGSLHRAIEGCGA